jgi:hypothetical protein
LQPGEQYPGFVGFRERQTAEFEPHSLPLLLHNLNSGIWIKTILCRLPAIGALAALRNDFASEPH